MLRYVKQGGSNVYDEPDTVKKLALTPAENEQVIEQAKILQEKYGIPIVPTCSMLERGCTAGTGKKVITVYGEACNCSALKWGRDKQRHKGQAACASRH